VGVGSQEFGGVVIAAEEVEVVGVDLDISSDRQVGGSDELLSLTVLVFVSSEERSFDDARVLLGRLEHRNGVVGKVEGDDESSFDVLGHFGVESSRVSQDLAVVVHVLEEINLRLLRDQVVDVAEGVFFVSETVVGRHFDVNLHLGTRVFNFSQRKSLSVAGEEVLGELVHSTDGEGSSVSHQLVFKTDLVAGEVSISDEVLAGLVDRKGFGKLLSLKVD